MIELLHVVSKSNHKLLANTIISHNSFAFLSISLFLIYLLKEYDRLQIG